MRRGRGLVLAVAVGALTGCTSDAGETSRAVVRTPPGVVVDTTCGRSADGGGAGGGGCNAGFALDSANYLFVCVPVRPGSVSTNQLGVGVRGGQRIVVRQLAGVDRAVAVAVGNDVRDCLESGRRRPAAWVFGFPTDPVNGGGHLESVLCRHGVLDARAVEAKRCATR